MITGLANPKRFLLLLVACYLVLLHVALIFAYIKLQQSTDRAYNDRLIDSMHGFNIRRDASIPSDQTIFLGDSHIHGLCNSCVIPGSINFGIPSNTITHLSQQLSDYTATRHAKSLIIHIGHNDLKRQSDAEILRSVESLIANLPARPQIFFSLQLPIDESLRADLAGYNNRKATFNQNLLKLCLDRCQIIDSWSPFVKQEQTSQLFENDGVHLNKAGYKKWQQTLKGHIDA